MSLERAITKNINDLNAECFERLTQFLCNRDITALSIACCLWLKDVTLTYDDIADFQQKDILAFLQNCGNYLKCFSIAKPHYSDILIYEMHQLLAKYCPNIESIDVVFSQRNVYVEHCVLALKNLHNLKNLVLTAPILSPGAAWHLSELKCLPQLELLKIHWTFSSLVDLSSCLKRCEQLKILHIRACALLNVATLQHCKNLEELQITEPKIDQLKSRHKKLHTRRWTFYEAFKILPKIKILHLAGTMCLSVANMRAIAQLPLLTRLTLQNFILCPCDGALWHAHNLLPTQALANLEEIHFVNVRYFGYSFDSLLLHLVHNCPKLNYIRLSEINLYGSSLLLDIIVLMTLRKAGITNDGPTKLDVVVENFVQHDHVLKNPFYCRLARDGILQIKFCKNERHKKLIVPHM